MKTTVKYVFSAADAGTASKLGSPTDILSQLNKQIKPMIMRRAASKMAYLFGGRQSVEAYLTALADGKVPGEEIGVDASAVVVNAYRHVVPNIRFFFDESGKTLVSDATSSLIAKYNSIPITQEELGPGDLIFFKDANGRSTASPSFR